MRIISGKLKGKSILFLKSQNTRPLKDSVKENIFNIISHSNLLKINIENSNVLDLYAGIGSFGLECISRGAKQITFVENNKNALELLNKNLSNLSIQSQALIVNDKIKNFLEKKQINKYQIIFLDPPFAENNFINELKIIKKKRIYQDNHIVVLHRERKSSDNFLEVINPIVIKQYQRSKIIFGKFLS